MHIYFHTDYNAKSFIFVFLIILSAKKNQRITVAVATKRYVKHLATPKYMFRVVLYKKASKKDFLKTLHRMYCWLKASNPLSENWI